MICLICLSDAGNRVSLKRMPHSVNTRAGCSTSRWPWAEMCPEEIVRRRSYCAHTDSVPCASSNTGGGRPCWTLTPLQAHVSTPLFSKLPHLGHTICMIYSHYSTTALQHYYSTTTALHCIGSICQAGEISSRS